MISYFLLQFLSCCVGGSFAPNQVFIVLGVSGNLSCWDLEVLSSIARLCQALQESDVKVVET